VDSNVGGTAYADSGDKGATWSINAGMALFHYIYGKITTVPPSVPVNLVTAVDLKLRVGSDGRFAVDAGASVLNTPEAAP